MSAPAIALIVIGSVLYLIAGIKAAGLIEYLGMDGDVFGCRWAIHVLALLAVPLWPVMLVLWMAVMAVGTLLG